MSYKMYLSFSSLGQIWWTRSPQRILWWASDVMLSQQAHNVTRHWYLVSFFAMSGDQNSMSKSNANVHLRFNTDTSWRWYLLFLGCVTKIQHKVKVKYYVKYWRQHDFPSQPKCNVCPMSCPNVNLTLYRRPVSAGIFLQICYDEETNSSMS